MSAEDKAIIRRGMQRKGWHRNIGGANFHHYHEMMTLLKDVDAAAHEIAHSSALQSAKE